VSCAGTDSALERALASPRLLIGIGATAARSCGVGPTKPASSPKVACGQGARRVLDLGVGSFLLPTVHYGPVLKLERYPTNLCSSPTTSSCFVSAGFVLPSSASPSISRAAFRPSTAWVSCHANQRACNDAIGYGIDFGSLAARKAATLWTGFDIFGEPRRTEIMALAVRQMNDSIGFGFWTPLGGCPGSLVQMMPRGYIRKVDYSWKPSSKQLSTA
jgi:hypothetical protein